MQKAIITFKNPELEDKNIVINFEIDNENQELKYNVEHNYSDEENMDFAGYLAAMFLNVLNGTEEQN